MLLLTVSSSLCQKDSLHAWSWKIYSHPVLFDLINTQCRRNYGCWIKTNPRLLWVLKSSLKRIKLSPVIFLSGLISFLKLINKTFTNCDWTLLKLIIFRSPLFMISKLNSMFISLWWLSTAMSNALIINKINHFTLMNVMDELLREMNMSRIIEELLVAKSCKCFCESC